MFRIRNILICLVIILFHPIVYADDGVHLECEITPQIWTLSPFEGEMVKSNDLRRKVGSPYFASGEFINITGEVLDSNCVPITEAIVEIWQADDLGNLPYPSHLMDIDPHFNYNGTATTDNMGKFSFLTIFPGVKKNEAPRVHFRVRHTDFPPMETYMYFPDNNLNNFDPDLKKIVDKNQKKLLISSYTGTESVPVSYNFNITLKGVNKYKRY